MQAQMKTIVHKKGCLHVETPLGIVNIRVGLTDSTGRRVDAIELLADENFGLPVILDGKVNNRFVEQPDITR